MADTATAIPDPTDIDAYLAKRGMMTYPQIDKKREELIGQYETAGQTEARGIEEGAAERKKLMAKPIDAPASPKLKDLPTAPDNTPQSPFQAFGSPAVFLATLGSLFTRHPLKVALDSATAAMKGYHEGDQQAVQAAQDRWKEATETAIKQNQLELDKYNAAWKATERNVAERQARMQAIAAGVQDQVMLAAIKTGNLDRVWQMLNSRQQANDKLQEVMLRERDRQEALAIQRKRAEAATNVGDTEPVSKAIAEGRLAPITGPAARSPWGQAVMNGVYQIKPEYDAAKDWFGKLGAEKVVAAAEPRANAATLSKLTQQKAAISQFEETAIKNGRILAQLVDKVDSTGIPVIERWTRAGKRAIEGDPDVSVFNTQLTAYRNEVAKILTNPNLSGALTVNAQQEAEHFLAGDDSARSIKAVIQLLEGDMGRRQESLDEQIAATKAALSGKPPDAGGAPVTSGSSSSVATPPASLLKEGYQTTFSNGQVWTLKDGKPTQVQ